MPIRNVNIADNFAGGDEAPGDHHPDGTPGSGERRRGQGHSSGSAR